MKVGLMSCYPEYLIYGKTVLTGPHWGIPIMTTGAGCPFPNNPTINYTKLKQDVTTEKNVMMCNAAHGFGA